jgi:hypothetical protein
LIDFGWLEDCDVEFEVGSGGGGDRILLGLTLTIGLGFVFGICVNDSVCLASGDDVGGDERGTSSLQPGVSAISKTVPGSLWALSKGS